MLHLHVQGLSLLMWHAVPWQLCFSLYVWPGMLGKPFLDIYSRRNALFGCGWRCTFSNYRKIRNTQNDSGFVKPSHIVTLVSSHHARHIKTCSRGTNMLIWPHPQLSALPALCRAPTVDGAVIGGIGTPPVGTRWAGSPHLQFWDAKAQRWALLCLLPLFAHMVFTLTNSTAVGPRNWAQWLRICLHFM